jgi:predicted Zn-dependent protease
MRLSERKLHAMEARLGHILAADGELAARRRYLISYQLIEIIPEDRRERGA